MIFTTKPYSAEHWLGGENASDTQRVGADETPLEYHLNRHSQYCSACANSSVWSELTLLSFNRARRTRIIRAAPVLEYNIPMFVHNHEPVVLPVCGECVGLAHFALRHLPSPAPAPQRIIPLGWRTGLKSPEGTARQSAEGGARPKAKPIVTDDDLLA